ncbi:MAG: hypothetical protein ACRBF0_13655 [Calditrichia bacterium]
MINNVQVTPLNTTLSENGYNIRAFDSAQDQSVELLQTLPGKLVGWNEFNVGLQLAFYSGLARIVLFDARRDAESYGRLLELSAGSRNAIRISVPAGVAISWKCCGNEDALILLQLPQKAKVKTHPIDTHLIPFSWEEH